MSLLRVNSQKSLKIYFFFQEVSQKGNALDLIKSVDYHNKSKRKETLKFTNSSASHINLGKIRLNSKFITKNLCFCPGNQENDGKVGKAGILITVKTGN